MATTAFSPLPHSGSTVRSLLTSNQLKAFPALWAMLSLALVSAINANAQHSFGLALSCDGFDDHVTASVPSLPIGDSAYTIEVWIKPVRMKEGGIVAWGNLSANQYNALLLTATGIQNSWKSGQNLSAVTGPLTNTWHHVAATYDGTTRRLYLDGTILASDTPPKNSATAGPLTIGKAVTCFEGELDELRIWNVARTSQQIAATRTQRLAGTEPGLVTYWGFDQPGAIVCYDLTPARHAGTMMNRARQVPSYWWPTLRLNGSNPMTNLNATPFFDPGAYVFGSVLDVAIGGDYSLALKADRTITAWGYTYSGITTVPSHATNVVAISAGGRPLALRADGTVVQWGSTASDTNVPPQATNIIAVAADLALRADGSLLAWGDNSFGRTNIPPEATNIVAIAGGNLHSLALRADGSVVGWGFGAYGQIPPPGSTSNIIAIAAGYYHSLALRRDGKVMAWGDNYYGQTNVPSNAIDVIAIRAGHYHSLALKADGSIVAWGDRTFGQNTIPAEATNIVTAAVGPEHTLAVRRDGTIVAWGQNYYRQKEIPAAANIMASSIAVTGSVDVTNFGPYTLNYSTTNLFGAFAVTNRLVQVLPPRPTVVTLPATSVINTSATLNGSVNPRGAPTSVWFEWGLNSGYGSSSTPMMVGNGTEAVPVSVPLSGFTQGRVFHYRLVASNGSGLTHGADQSFSAPAVSLVGTTPLTNECHFAFQEPGTSVKANPLAIDANQLYTIVLPAHGRPSAWGSGTYGQLNVPSSATNVIAVGAGWQHGLALRADGTVVGWGDNSYGQLNVPSSVTNVIKIAVGDWFNLALKADGSIVGWGHNSYGQCNAPASATNVVAISAGNSHALALRADGTLVGWGESDNSLSKYIPPEATNIIAISAGGSHSLVLRADRKVIAWGYDYYHQSTVPPEATNVVAISAGTHHSVALRADGTVVAWGDPNLGKTVVPAYATNVVAIAAGDEHNYALRADGTSFGWGYGAYGQTASADFSTAVSIPVFSSSDLEVNVPGTYTINYVVTNLSGGVGTTQRTVIVQDTLAPIIGLRGPDPIGVAVGGPWIDPGAQASDICGGDLTSGIQVSGNVDVSAAGHYVLTYTASDASGNLAQVQRTVVVGMPAATTLQASNLTDTSARLNGSASPMGVPSVAWFEWGGSVTYGNQSTPVLVGSGVTAIEVNHQLEGLDRELNYHYRLVVSNSMSVARGQDQTLWWPKLRLNGPGFMTNECHVAFNDPISAEARPVAIAVGSQHNLALRPDGSVVSWGTSVPFPPDIRKATEVDCGWQFSMARTADGKVVAWGSNSYGQTNVPAGLTNVLAISAGLWHALALQADGTVVAWGSNNHGETNVPANLLHAVAVSAGGYHNLALKANGSVVVWGDSANGLTNIPPEAVNIVAISAGSWHNLALKSNGSVIAWGHNLEGQCNVPAEATNIVAISGGHYHSLALRADGTVLAWGRNANGQTSVPAAATNIAAIAAGETHSLALRKDGTLIGWGGDYYLSTSIPSRLNTLATPITITGGLDANSPGVYELRYAITNELGATSYANRTVTVTDTQRPALSIAGTNPVVVPVGAPFQVPAATATDLCAGDLTANIVVTGAVDTNTAGQYTLAYIVADPSGNTTQSNRTVLVGLPQASTFAVSNLIDSSVSMSGTINTRGAETTAWFEWGASLRYELGQLPVTVAPAYTNIFISAMLSNLSPGVLYHSRLVASNAAGISRGEHQMFWLPGVSLNGPAQLTNQCHMALNDPGVQLAALVAIDGGAQFSAMLRANGTVQAWGYGTSQTNVPPAATNVVSISCGDNRTVALKRDGTLVIWGYSSYGEGSVPQNETNLVAVSAGYWHNLALRANGSVLAWGNNYFGQTAVPSAATNIIGVAAGNYFSLALRADGRPLAWGDNSYGQANIPPTATNVIAIAAGDGHCMALREDGRVIAWGLGSEGQTNVPPIVTNVVAIAAHGKHSLALRRDGWVIDWGTGQTSVPFSATNIAAIGAGKGHSLAIRADGRVFGWGASSYGQLPSSTLNPLNLPIVTAGTVDVNIPGSYSRTYQATNIFSASASIARSVQVIDSLPPKLSLLGYNPTMVLVGQSFTEPGATADDLCAGDLTSGIIYGGQVDSNSPGTYTRTYFVSDAHGNFRTTNRTVLVVTLPELRVLPLTNTSGFALTYSNTPGARFNVIAQTNLLEPPGAWILLGPALETSPGQFQFTDTQATNFPDRFYRLVFP